LLADTLGLDGDIAQSSWAEALPTLSAWRRGRHEQAVINSLCYRITWTPLTQKSAEPALSGTWLLIRPARSAHDALAKECIAALSEHGASVAQVVLDSLEIDREQFTRSLPDSEPISGALSLLALAETGDSEQPCPSSGVVATHALLQLLDEIGIAAPLWCATQGATKISDSDLPIDLMAAQFWGFGRVMALDRPHQWGGLVDLPPVLHRREHRWLCAVLAGDAGEDQVAVRPSGVFCRRLVNAPRTEHSTQRTWHPNGTVLVTGGTEVAGANIARWLARAGVEHLLLSSREGPRTSGAPELEAELADSGTLVTIASCDMRSREAVEHLLAQVPDEHPLTAVIHAEGVGQINVFGATSMSEFAHAVTERVSGAVHLDELLRTHRLDAFVLLTSVAGVWGSGGQAPYSAASACLDGLAEKRRAQGLPAVSVAYGPWSDGRGADQSYTPADQLRRRGILEIAAEPAVSALVRAVEHDEAFLAVADIDWERFVPGFTSRRDSPLLKDLSAVQRLQDAADEQSQDLTADLELTRHLAEASKEARQQMLLEIVRVAVADVLGHATPESIEADRVFKDLGFDSLTAIQLRNRLRTATGLPLSSSLIYDYPNADALANYLSMQFEDSQADPLQDVLTHLADLETKLLSSSLGEEDQAIANERLNSLLEKLDNGYNASAVQPADISDRLDAASDDEIFSFIDNEL
jgi:NAD(P)-dependent dehydrogenase (short-subunit alcohol dehydrogenase family)/acyl carrier protein